MPTVPAGGIPPPEPPPNPAVHVIPTEYLEIDGFSLATPGWVTNSLAELLDAGDIRTHHEVIPHASGVLSYKQRVTISERSIPLTIFGSYDADGVPYGNVRQGVEMNLLAIRNAIYTPSTQVDGTRQGVLHLAAGLWYARVKIIGSLSPTPFSWDSYRAVITMQLPYGPFKP